MEKILLPVMKTERFSTKDGAGIRTVIFLKGCPLRCAWCHNPEGLHVGNELIFEKKRCIGCEICEKVCKNGVHSFKDGEHIINREKCNACFECVADCPASALTKAAENMSIDEIVKNALRDKAFYKETGGVTLSGGEPMLHGEKTVSLLTAFKEKGLNTALETSGYFPSEFIPRLVGIVDTFLFDVKDTNEERHKKYTGVSNKRIIENLRSISDLGAHIIIRRIVVPGVNDSERDIKDLLTLRDSLSNRPKIEYLPYHPYGNGKYESVGIIEPKDFSKKQ